MVDKDFKYYSEVLTDELEFQVPPEMLHFIKVMEMGASKYEPNGWLKTDGTKTSHKDMHASMFRHLAESSAGIRADHESGFDPLLHLACRALMMYTRIQKGL